MLARAAGGLLLVTFLRQNLAKMNALQRLAEPAAVLGDDRAGLAEYAAHPAHVPVAARFRAATAQLLAVDLEL